MTNKNYPHPVLNKNTDDFNSTLAYFNIQILQKVDGANYKLSFIVDLREDNLEHLLSVGAVKFAIKIECPTTKYKTVFEFDKLVEVFTLPASYVEKKVKISTFIVAKKHLTDYSSNAFDEDYEGTTFSIFVGDILAEGPVYLMDIEKKLDSLTKIPSIFTIISNSDLSSPQIDVRTSDNKIVITLNKRNFDKYANLKQLQNQYGNLAALMSSLFIVPAFVMVLEEIRRDLSVFNNDHELIKDYIEEKENSHRWFKVINMKLKEHLIELSDPESISDSSLVLTQKLLGNPFSTGLEFFDELYSTQEEEENL